jgi:hypothetical protein
MPLSQCGLTEIHRKAGAKPAIWSAKFLHPADFAVPAGGGAQGAWLYFRQSSPKGAYALGASRLKRLSRFLAFGYRLPPHVVCIRGRFHGSSAGRKTCDLAAVADVPGRYTQSGSCRATCQK